jgi:hypothetical protein
LVCSACERSVLAALRWQADASNDATIKAAICCGYKRAPALRFSLRVFFAKHRDYYREKICKRIIHLACIVPSLKHSCGIKIDLSGYTAVFVADS